jgi:glycosyltransferase involved in cell wall biosynthesis
MPSHHQSAFFQTLERLDGVDLIVRYFSTVSAERIDLGWDNKMTLAHFEGYVETIEGLKEVPDWKERIHIVPGFSGTFLKQLLSELLKNKIKWIHWSERSGKGLTKTLNYQYSLINALLPVFYLLKGYYRYSKLVNNQSLGSFAISNLAKKDFLRWGISEKKVRVVNYGLADLAFSKENINSANKTFMFVGAITKHKGVEYLIKAFYRIAKVEIWSLVLVGKDFSEGYYQDLVENLGLSNSVHFLGPIESKNISSVIASCDVLILPTLFDGWGAVLNEAASLSKPLISTNQSGAAHHLIVNNYNGFRIKAKSVTDLHNAMLNYTRNPSLIVEHGEKSYEIFLNNSVDKCASIFKESVLSLLLEANK